MIISISFLTMANCSVSTIRASSASLPGLPVIPCNTRSWGEKHRCQGYTFTNSAPVSNSPGERHRCQDYTFTNSAPVSNSPDEKHRCQGYTFTNSAPVSNSPRFREFLHPPPSRLLISCLLVK